MTTPTTTSAVAKKSPWFSNATYDFIKQLATYWFPAAGTLYAALALIWGFPYATQIVGSIAAIDIFLGVLLGASTAVYNASGAGIDGALVVDTSSGTETHSLEFNAPLTTLSTQKSITLAVTPATPTSSSAVSTTVTDTNPASQN